MNKHFIAKELLDYCEKYSALEDQILKQLTRETHITQYQPHMLSGHLQGRFLSMMAKLIAPKNILEIGTYTGYAALCLAEGLQADGQLITIDVDAEKEWICNKYFQQSKYANQIKMMIGDAQKIIPTLSMQFDLVFIDADKINYWNYYEIVLPKLNAGGCILVDNVLFNGDVLNENKNKNAAAVHMFNTKIAADSRIEKVIVPIRDGITMIRKK
jgi:predicted O-methyltransferase YrrM